MRRRLTLALALAITPAAHAQTPADPTDASAHPAQTTIAQIADGYRYTDTKGMTLYVLDPREARARSGNPMTYCVAACAARFVPLPAPADAPPAGLWKPAQGPRGPQWTYRGAPVFTAPADQAPGDTTGDGYEDIFHPIAYVPATPTMPAPAPMAAQYLKGRFYLADPSGHVLFTSGTPTAQPFTAGLAAHNFGAWTVIDTATGPQWAWQGQPVYIAATANTLPDSPGAQPISPTN